MSTKRNPRQQTNDAYERTGQEELRLELVPVTCESPRAMRLARTPLLTDLAEADEERPERVRLH
jgi:hypothetical protein